MKYLRKLFQGFGVVPNHGGSIATIDERILFNADGLATWHNSDFVQEDRFRKAYQAGIDTPHHFGSAINVQWRVKVALWAAEMGLKRNGDFVECGVNSGILSRAIMEYTGFSRFPERKFYLLDTYNGLVEGTIDENDRQRLNQGYPDIYEQVVEVFKPFPNAVVVRGAIPGTLFEVKSDAIAYLSIDLNCVEPEQDAIREFWPRLTSGAIVVLDDYGFRGHEKQKTAWDKFAQEQSVPLLPLPTGQGILIKP